MSITVPDPDHSSEDELQPEYDLSKLLKDGVQGKYAERFQQGANLILLDPDVARAFPSSKEVNEALRLLIQTARLAVNT